jgi:integrase
MGNLYQDPKSRMWYGRICISGRILRKSLRTTDQREAVIRLKEWEVTVYRGKTAQEETKSALRLFDLCEQYLAATAVNKQPSTYAWEQLVITRHLLPFFGDIAVEEITTLRVEQYKHTRRTMVKPQTVNQELTVLQMLLYAAVRWELLSVVPCKIQKLLIRETHQVAFLQEQEVHKLLAVAATPWTKTLIMVAVNTGLRKGELLRLRWSDLDWERRLMHVQGRTKTGRARSVPINQSLLPVLKHWRLQQGGGEYVISVDGKRPIRDPKRSVHSAYRRAGLPYRGLHILRHTFASHLAMKRVDLPTMQRLLGHGSIRTTMIYAHLTDQHVQHAAEQIQFSLPDPVGVVLPMTAEWAAEPTRFSQQSSG